MNECYDKLQTLIDMHGFDATRMFSMDESGITTVQKPDKVHRKKGKKQIGYLTNGRQYKNGVLHECRGYFVPPMMISKCKRMVESLKIDCGAHH